MNNPKIQLDKKEEYDKIIIECYLNLLGRKPDKEGFEYYLSLLQSESYNKDNLIKDITSSQEYKNNPLILNQNTVSIINEFHRIYYGKDPTQFPIWARTYWLGTQIMKCPLDLWTYQEIIFNIRPDWIIESGTFSGGSALFLASICDLVHSGTIITIDIIRKDYPSHPRMKYLTGSSIDNSVVNEVKNMVNPSDKVLVILDSDHSMNHVQIILILILYVVIFWQCNLMKNLI